MTCTTRNGHKVYKCLEGKWAYQGGESQMVDARTHSNYVGVYRETLTPAKKTRSGWWELLNDDGDSAESGYQYSTVTGKKLILRNSVLELRHEVSVLIVAVLQQRQLDLTTSFQ